MDQAAIRRIGRDVAGWAEGLLGFFYQPSSLMQIAVVVGCFVAGFLLNRLTRQPLENQARKIKGAPRVLRLVVAIRRRMTLIYTVFLLWIATLVDAVAGGPRSKIIGVVLSLGLAYLAISIASRLIRNRLLSRMITVVAWGLAALSILDLLAPVTQVLSDMAINVGQTKVSALLVIKAIAVLAATLWVASAVGNFLDTRIQRSQELTPTLRVLLGKFLKIGLVLVALAVALASIGVDLTALTVLSGAIGVGLGFGLQKVVSNFISGIIILLDRSIKPGDTISLDDTFGWIRELRARFVSVVTRDGKEYLIPNEDFITNKVINWSFSNDLVRIDVDFGVSYLSDPHQVTELAIAAAGSVERVVNHKGIVCWITGFGDSSIDFVLRFWIRDPPGGLTNVKGQVFMALWDAFKENDINIPFPHREIIMRTPVDIRAAGDGDNSLDPARFADAANRGSANAEADRAEEKRDGAAGEKGSGKPKTLAD